MQGVSQPLLFSRAGGEERVDRHEAGTDVGDRMLDQYEFANRAAQLDVAVRECLELFQSAGIHRPKSGKA